MWPSNPKTLLLLPFLLLLGAKPYYIVAKPYCITKYHYIAAEPHCIIAKPYYIVAEVLRPIGQLEVVGSIPTRNTSKRSKKVVPIKSRITEALN